MAKIAREKWKTYGNVFDQFTMRNLFKLQTEGHFEELKSTISPGKEANVFSALTKDKKKVIVKIYRLETCNFNKMWEYIKGDPRYEHLKKRRREIIFAWTQREYRNLFKARDAGVRVPLPLTFKENIIVMEHIGKTEVAPQLKDAIPSSPSEFYDKVILYMKKMHKHNLVHGDLSTFNILNDNEKPVFIDFSQGTTTEAQNYIELLKRDIHNIAMGAKKAGLILNEELIFQEIIETKE